jgi:hypothetical protein
MRVRAVSAAGAEESSPGRQPGVNVVKMNLALEEGDSNNELCD